MVERRDVNDDMTVGLRGLPVQATSTTAVREVNGVTSTVHSVVKGEDHFGSGGERGISSPFVSFSR